MPFKIPRNVETRLADSPSRNVFITGTAPQTDASKDKRTPARSAATASSTPCAAINALFAVTTCLPLASAAAAKACATPLAPPIASTTTSTSLRAASASGASTHSIPDKSHARFLPLSRALTATTVMACPAREASKSALPRNSRNTAAPTFPNPARAIRIFYSFGDCGSCGGDNVAPCGAEFCGAASGSAGLSSSTCFFTASDWAR